MGYDSGPNGKNAHESKLIWKLWYFWVPDLRPLFGPHNADMWAIFCHKLWVPFLLPISDRRKETTWNPFLGRIFDTPFWPYFWDPNHKKLDQNWDSKSGPKSVIEFQYVSMCVCFSMVGILTERSAGGSHPAVKWCAPQLRLQFAQASKKKQMRHDKLWCMQVGVH